ncbi:hypothetical protein [[Clostridium] innocuum]|uniref:hypothetical protein n=1 Tax=Clostridium innocuum TaxID=1522 RepID=UPI003A4E1D2D
MAGKERYKREIAMLFPYMSKKEKMFLNNYMQNIEDAEYKDIVKEWGAPRLLRSNLMEQRYLLIRRTRFCCSSFSFTKYADSTELKRLHNIHYAK